MTPQVLCELKITLLADGNVSLSGPIGDKVLCYGLLERAKDVVREYDPRRVQPAPSTPNGLPLFGPKVG